jgi:multiple sugar transport system substrate-binding protein
MNSDERLRRSLRDALPPEPGFPDPHLLGRIMHRLPKRRRLQWGQRPWMPAVVALALVLVAVDLLTQSTAANGAGRVEFLGTVQFVSSQAQPADEYRAMTRNVLAGFNGIPDFNSQPTAAQDVARIQYEQAAGRSTIDLVALAHGDMATLQRSGSLQDLTPLLAQLQRDRRFPPDLLEEARFGTSELSYVPWLQATYLLAVNRKALPYLPAGADVQHLTYDQLVAWGENMRAATGRNLIGLPADLQGPRGGLIFRFLQGYAYPSYTGTTLTGFRSPEAVQMWQMLRRLWAVTDPRSTQYTDMSGPLKNGDVWVAWDHQVRLDKVLDDPRFIAVPAPGGPAGLGYISVVVGLAIPVRAPNQEGAEALADWLTRPRQQAAAAVSLGFFPAVGGVRMVGPQASELAVSDAYRGAPDRVQTVLPVGLGGGADAFNGVYQESFQRIVLNGEDIATVLNEEAPALQRIVDEANAPCWAPDPRGAGPCQVR